jgi:hypothetical protein
VNRPPPRTIALGGVLAVLVIAALAVWFWPNGESVRPDAQTRSDEINQSMNAAAPPAPAEPAPIQRAPRGSVKVK